ncbi:IS110 family transposase [Atribacter sp.]|jgi:transposase|uniref:IS110 family transposase n=1 Tax=Atribacter sp. TaxID=2847780 RepID=UPI00345EE48E
MNEHLLVGIDVGCHSHQVAIAKSNGTYLKEFGISHNASGFNSLFSEITYYESTLKCPVVIGMEGFNGYARPLDQLIQQKGYTLYNINNLKLARFKELFSGPAKTDAIDARKIVEFMRIAPSFQEQRRAITEIKPGNGVNQTLKRLTRRRRQLVNEKICIQNRMQADLQSVAPGLVDLVKNVDSRWYLHFLTCRPSLRQLATMRKESLLKIKGVGKKYAAVIASWQKEAHFSTDVDLVSSMIIEDAKRILELMEAIATIEQELEPLGEQSDLAVTIGSIPGFGLISSAELAGEIDNLSRFPSEKSLALYLGMAPLDNSSGKKEGCKIAKSVNTRAKAAMMVAVAHHSWQVEESKRYYEKKRAEGKKHNQAIRSLGRHLVRVIWSLIKEKRFYEIREENERNILKMA